MAKSRSPIKEPPLRLPGQSVDAEIDRLWTDEAMVFMMIAVLAFALAVFEWVSWLTKTPPAPILYSVLAALAISFSLIRLTRVKKRVRALKLGRDGERLVAEELDKLKATGAVVFHDILGPTFNVDHVVVSRHGVYAVETKTFSKTDDGKVIFDGTTLLIDGRPPQKDLVGQVIAIADWVRDTLKRATGKDFPVRPVLVFPGWWVNPVKEHHRARVWVLNPEAVPAFITQAPLVVSEEDLRSAVYLLARYIRLTPPPV
jgi:hypothetical protein